jgi:plasmid stability protein
MEEEAVRWNVKVSRETDLTLRTFLGARGMKNGDRNSSKRHHWRVFSLRRSGHQVVTPTPIRAGSQRIVDKAVAELRAERQAEGKQSLMQPSNVYNMCMQYTIRNVPDILDKALRRAARERGKSLNEVAVEALARGAGVTGERVRQRDLNDIAGTWSKDPAFDSAFDAQDTVNEEMWK